jgi:predicted membrane-bound dolichyl-phosphate-mannose-protein mannosyltransferase
LQWGVTLPGYRDEEVYIGCGVAYVSNFTPPMLCNFEHPPFAKYVIGFSSILGFSRDLFLMFYVFSCIFLFLIVYNVSGDFLLGLFSSLFLFFDTLFFNVHRFLLLDPVAVFFSLISLYLVLKGFHRVGGVFAGFSVASKFSSAPMVFVSMYIVYRGGGFRKVLWFFLFASLSYLTTYIADFRLGIDAVFKHHVEILRYMSWRHGFSIPIAVNGFLKLLTKIEFWRFVGSVEVSLSNISSVYTIVNQTFVKMNKVFVVGLGMGSPLWYLLFPALLYTTYLALTNRLDRVGIVAVISSWFSLLNIVAGPIDWYYINVLPYLYMNFAVALRSISRSRYEAVGIAIAVLCSAMFLATVFNVIPFKIEFMR